MQIILNDKSYNLPSTIEKFNSEFLNSYKTIIDDNEYFRMDEAIKDNKLNELKRLYDQICDTVGILTMDEPLSSDIWAEIRTLDNLYKIHIFNKDYDKAFEKLEMGMDIILGQYNELLKEEEITQSR